jgi:hypothetical protein
LRKAMDVSMVAAAGGSINGNLQRKCMSNSIAPKNIVFYRGFHNIVLTFGRQAFPWQPFAEREYQEELFEFQGWNMAAAHCNQIHCKGGNKRPVQFALTSTHTYIKNSKEGRWLLKTHLLFPCAVLHSHGWSRTPATFAVWTWYRSSSLWPKVNNKKWHREEKAFGKCFTFPESTTNRTPSIVTDVSAMLVDTMHLRTPSGGKSNT